MRGTKAKEKEVVEKSSSMGRFLLVFCFRLLLLIVGGSSAALAGIWFATVSPAKTPNKPLVAKILPLPGDVKKPEPELNNPTVTEQASSEPEVAIPPAPKLTPQQRNKLQTDLKQLQTQLKSLSDRTTALEKQLGSNNSQEALETRLQVIAQQIKPNPSLQKPTATAPAPAVDLTSSSVALISPETLTATLPSDALFQDNQAAFRPEARLILDKLSAELQKYPNSTVRITAHTDGAGEASNNRVLSFRQAEAVTEYLTGALGNKYHLVAIGYGETRPIAPNDTQINLQRNRRLEISVGSD